LIALSRNIITPLALNSCNTSKLL